MISKKERIDLRKKEIGNKRDRRRFNHSTNFNSMFKFFFSIVYYDFLSFCGSNVSTDYDIIFDINGEDAKKCFKRYENGEYKLGYTIKTCHPNILLYVIIGKKSWGLWKDEYGRGIAEGTFTKYEILEEFRNRNIEIPEVFMNEITNRIWEFRFNNEIKNKELHKLEIDFICSLYQNYK
jgi:hypothetical protein